MCLCVCLVTQSPPTLCDPTDCSPPGSSVHPRQEYWSGQPFPSPGGLPHSGVEPRSPALQVYSLPSEPPGKPQITPYKLSIVFNVLRLPFPEPSHLVNSYSTFTFWTNISISGKVYVISLNSFCSVIIPL